MTTTESTFRPHPQLLKQLAESENRSLTNMVETLIIDKAKEKVIAVANQ